MKITPIPFHTRLNLYIFGFFLLFLIAVFIFQFQRERSFSKQSLMYSLVAYADRIEKEVATALPADTFAHLPVVKEMDANHARITLIDLNGKVLFDTDAPNLSELENHLKRPEIQTARRKGVGYSIRQSSTLLTPYFYAAKFYGNYYIRVSLPYNASTEELLAIDKSFIALFLILMAIVFGFLFRYTGRLGKNISRLRDFTARADHDGNIDYEVSFTDDDIGRISENIVCIYKRLLQTRNELGAEKEKLYKHLLISKEGLAVFDSSNQATLSNSLFIQYLNLIADKHIDTPNDLFSIDDFSFVSLFLQQNRKSDAAEILPATHTTVIEKSSKVFEVKTILFHDGGYEVSINNITQEMEESRLKRQLTQNISHELRTPVSSIRGFLETILNTPELDAATRNGFIRRSFDQTTRLIDLLTDISTLNRLDEATTLYKIEQVSLASIIRDVCTDVAAQLRQRNMSVRLLLKNEMPIAGSSSLLYSIFRNLMDNAIAYAGEHTTVCINCYLMSDEYYFISFSDSGIGVDPQHLNRLFERFYRVDKGRSRKMGGTGLGLAIVKNAVLFHQGEISVKNSIGGGLEFLFTLKRAN